MPKWTLNIPNETDQSVREYLARTGDKYENLSTFVNQAVKSEILRNTINDIHTQNKDADPTEIQRLVDEAVDWVRANRS